jgi:signal transduction histidine kinase
MLSFPAWRVTHFLLMAAAALALDQPASQPAVTSGQTIQLMPTGNNSQGQEKWTVPADTGTHACIFPLSTPLSAKRVRLKIEFHGPDPSSFFREFAFSATSDVKPSASSPWTPMFPAWFSSMEGKLHRRAGHLYLDGATQQPDLLVDCHLPFDEVTAIRLEVFMPDGQISRTAVVTSLLLETIHTGTTNVALGCPVKASHPLPVATPADFLTDGLRDTEVSQPALLPGSNFSFVLDLKQHRDLDHLHFRFKADAPESVPRPRIKVELFQTHPGPGVKPDWQTEYHLASNKAEPAVTEMAQVLRANAGVGRFGGRYLRISNDGGSAVLPPLTEVEVYPLILPLAVTAHIGGRAMRADPPLDIPDSASWLAFSIEQPNLADPVHLSHHWRILGFKDEWQIGNSSGIAESRCPPAGSYEFQAAIRHTDGEWNDVPLSVPVVVTPPLWRQPWMRLSIAMLAPAALALLTGWVGTRVMTRRVAELERHNELSAERARIARDMHDAVGSQLTQLTVLHEIMADDPALSVEHREKLRDLANTARASVAALDEIVWAVNPINDTLANLAGYLTHAAREYMRPLGITCRQDVPLDWPERSVPAHIRHQLFLAFREALHNVVKHAQADEVTITLRYSSTDSVFIVNIADDGVGLPEDTQGIEKDGLENMRDRLSSFGGHCRVRLRTGSGTIVEMKIPIPA